ncbi:MULTISPECIES: YlmH/Sll1252 family protein [unclassified Enterococcus]|uniref:YlmH family RNA-binding protein n=1 Tax=unclassified Enterococcus TaxID=2608891 RepID=UPI001556C9E6|nr:MULTISPECIES: YlmH/Sll1252 family protein [unclassified Enterococcus]MBS7577648.1 RNA-binding protein [Enterococcus sp. MMGLQ5-2]MBS7584158.1 RNA-binding protein [Enterococcus sp. MMGLQ5-1]NPD12016.1 RNA-binding protein [Enterococcus sp. MMGLQ5-1]NPD37481.1 RNA-binding protein [Enterococcus sp. MMGLQ5-2]
MFENIYQHFKKDEKNFIEQMNAHLIEVEESYTPFLTHFLNPRELWILKTLINRYNDLKFRSFGGTINAESQRVIVVPEFMEIEAADFHLALLEVHYPVKFATLSHSEILGTLLSQGIERYKIGDILTDGTRFQVIVDEVIADFLINQIDRISALKVRLERKDITELIVSSDEFIEKALTINSLRLDILISNVYNISRERSKLLIERGSVKLNFQLIEKVSEEISLFDLISVRGFGRFRLDSINGLSKKGKIKIVVAVLLIDRSSK